MKTIWKFHMTITDTDTDSIRVPAGAKLLGVHMQNGIPCLWAIVDPDADRKVLTILWRATGEPFTGAEGDHVGTIHYNGLVFHAFTQVKHAELRRA